MSKYVYFRDAHGGPYRGQDGKHAPVALLSAKGLRSVRQENGTVAWKGWPSDDDQLFSAFVVLDPAKNELNQFDSRKIVSTALSEVAGKGIGAPLNAAEVLHAANSNAASFFRKDLTNFRLVTTLSVKDLPAKQISILGHKIRPLLSRGNRYPLPKILKTRTHGSRFDDHTANTKYQAICIDTAGRSVFEAEQRAIEALDLLRALWSFGSNSSHRTYYFGNQPRRPIGVIHSGPIYTLHNLDGTGVDDGRYLYDPEYVCDFELFDPGKKWERIERDRKWALRQIARLPYGRDLTELLVRYVSAMDQVNPEVAFLLFWGILEKITDTVGANYDETIRRTCWVFSQKVRPLIKETLQSLRHYRNRYVHSGKTMNSTDAVSFVYQIKAIVDPHFSRLLSDNFHITSIQEYGEFLSYPTDIATLKKMRTWAHRGILATREDENAD